MGSFQSSDLIETFINYQESIKRCVCIIYDPTLSSQNGLAMKAIRLKEVFIQNFSIGSVLSVEKVKAAGIAWRDIFEEIPIQIQNPPLVTALVMQLEPPVPATQLDFDRYNMSCCRAPRSKTTLKICCCSVLSKFNFRVCMKKSQLASPWEDQIVNYALST